MFLKKKVIAGVSFLVLVLISLFAGIFLGKIYIYNLIQSDKQWKIELNEQNEKKRMVLRLEPTTFYTVQIGVYQDKDKAKQIAAELQKNSLPSYVTVQEPYKIWVGCFSDASRGTELLDYLKGKGYKTFIGEGLLNDRALKFYSDDLFMKDSFAPLLGQYNLFLNHTLKMFKSPHLADYTLGNWEKMIQRLKQEAYLVLKDSGEILNSENILKNSADLQLTMECTDNLIKKLDGVLIQKTDEHILECQKKLLELIAAYHHLIIKTNEIYH